MPSGFPFPTIDRSFWLSFPVVFTALAVATVAGVAASVLLHATGILAYWVGGLVLAAVLYSVFGYRRPTGPPAPGPGPSLGAPPGVSSVSGPVAAEDFADPVEEADRLGTLRPEASPKLSRSSVRSIVEDEERLAAADPSPPK
jgi:hypothetical protein